MTDGYQEAGFAHLREAIDPDLVAEWRAPFLEAAERMPNRAKAAEIAAVLQPNLVDAEMARILCSPVLGRIAAEILGTDEIRLIAAAAYIKPPGAPATFWHQDLWYFPIVGAPMTTLWLPFTPVDPDRAPMVYVPGSHRLGFADWRADAPPEGRPQHCMSPMAVGDVAIHDGWTLHGSKANHGSQPREALGLSFIRAGTRFATRSELRREPRRWERLETYLDDGGYREGEPIDGPECPSIALT